MSLMGMPCPPLGAWSWGVELGCQFMTGKRKSYKLGDCLTVRPCENTLYLAPERFWQL